MTRYEILVAVHVVMAIVWVGSDVAIQLFAVRAIRSGDPRRVVAISRDIEWIGTRVLMPASVVLLVAGIWAANEGNWDFGSPWIGIGFAGFTLSFVVGAGFLGPQSGRLARVVEAEGDESSNAVAIVRRLLVVSRLELVALLIVVVAMVGKWGS